MKMMTKKGDAKIVQCAVVGDGLVGKTSIAMKFAKKNVDSYVATVFDNVAGSLSVAGDMYTVSIFDTAGQQDFEGLRVFTYNESDVILVCYSVIDRESFRNVEAFWLPEVRSYIGTKKSVILIGTQQDRRNEATFDDEPAVTYEEGLALAQKIKAETFIECSTNDANAVNRVFESTVMSALKYKKRKVSLIKKILGK